MITTTGGENIPFIYTAMEGTSPSSPSVRDSEIITYITPHRQGFHQLLVGGSTARSQTFKAPSQACQCKRLCATVVVVLRCQWMLLWFQLEHFPFLPSLSFPFIFSILSIHDYSHFSGAWERRFTTLAGAIHTLTGSIHTLVHTFWQGIRHF